MPLAIIVALAFFIAVPYGGCFFLYRELRKVQRELDLRIGNEHCGLMLLSDHVNLVGNKLKEHVEHHNQHPNA